MNAKNHWSTDSIQYQDFETKNGKKIDFKFIENSLNNKIESLWVVNTLEAYVDGNKAGFISIGYIPQNIWNERIENRGFHPVIVSADYFGGSGLGFKNSNNNPEEHSVLSRISLDVAYDLHQIFKKENVGTKKYNEEKEFVMKRFISKKKEKYHETLNFHVEQPLVDYITTNEEYRRQGIAQALYYTMATIIAENGYRMRSSGIKTEEGNAHSKAFHNKYPETVIKEDGYYFIDIFNEDAIMCA